MNWENFKNSVVSYVERNNSGNVGEYRMCAGGECTLYSSCFAVMTLFYCDSLRKYTQEDMYRWGNYINRWQDKNSGLYIGPEVVEEELTSQAHDFEHISMHLTAHVLPSLSILGIQPRYPMYFAHSFLSKNELTKWLDKRDLKNAWLEGNNLLFILQFLIYLRDYENIKEASHSLELMFEWLDSHIDPETGLWGTNGYCSPYEAMYGGYHQLLAYYYEKREIKFKEKIIDTVLSLQHGDGGFHRHGGGGACEDVDGGDILVNLYKITDYRRAAVRFSLRRLYKSILRRQKESGGFVYRSNSNFIYMGIKKTYTPNGTANMFATWFSVHTLALINEILPELFTHKGQINFNETFSMGWHERWNKENIKSTRYEILNENIKGYMNLFQIWNEDKKKKFKRKIKKHLHFSDGI